MTAAEIISIITAVTALVAAVGVVLVNLKTAKISEDVSHVKVLVNSAKDASDTYQADLIQALKAANVQVPEDQSVVLTSDATRAQKHL